jgi:selenocysteine lyase/cysteine desulfurase
LQIGIKRKEDRLRYLQQYWIQQVNQIKRIQLNTPSDNGRSCAIANVTIEGYKPADLAKILMDKYKIWTVAIDNANAGVQGIRVTPHLYTQVAELDQFINALTQLAK